MTKRVYIAVINDLVTDQRVRRVVDLLVDLDADVCCIGRVLPGSPPLTDELKCRVKRYRMLFRRGPFFYAFYNIRLFFTLLVAPSPSLIISNDLDTLPACSLLARIRKVALIYDSHELFTEVPELIDRKLVQAVWLALEGRLLPRLKHAITVSPSIAKYYKKLYGVPFRVVRNLPEFRETEQVLEREGRPVLIYQGALNVGRGIELMIKGMKHLEEVELKVVGSGDIEKELRAFVEEEALGDRVHFTGRIRPAELSALTCRANLGLSLEEDRGLNYRFSLPNKIFDYIQCRIPVLCSDLPEMASLVRSAGVGRVLEERSPEAFAAAVREMLVAQEGGSYDTALGKASGKLCWEKEKEIYLAILEDCGMLN